MAAPQTTPALLTMSETDFQDACAWGGREGVVMRRLAAEINAQIAQVAALREERDKIAAALHIEQEDGAWWTKSDEGDVDCDSFADAVLKTFQFASNSCNAAEAEVQRLTEALQTARKALEMADVFTQPGISRGPAIQHWSEMRAAVLAALRTAGEGE